MNLEFADPSVSSFRSILEISLIACLAMAGALCVLWPNAASAGKAYASCGNNLG
ncbi:hypothetical protein [Xanthomonas theicola]|uniref:hypothetical protein n=1 Tax=Xanthomonas theicola TaxID=56464 RepID=UPI0013047EB6|nr:hypothetical protein [Xanthomonas theicola]QNH26762.1 hypothetical protein G4Q83_21410 [Xanthomonas theicola]